MEVWLRKSTDYESYANQITKVVLIRSGSSAGYRGHRDYKKEGYKQRWKPATELEDKYMRDFNTMLHSF